MSKDERFYRAYMEHREVSRRGLLRGLFKGAQDAVEQEARKLEIKADVIRPPGAVGEALFRQQCNGCGDCVTACPESLIVMNGGYPALDFIANYCSRCGECVKACGQGALLEGTFRLNGRPLVQHTCQNRYMYCDTCRRRCQKSAIVWQSSLAPTIDAEKCDGCGECAFACPVNALEMTVI
ncbi:(Fe-S)-binding protein [Leminorella grimontii]|uniref:(Fe-S)-binding protein n=1 Tax=Leminorella grimontii TaxID=82981 RepID=A0AAV5N4L5_9GAMM|nr:4Fe-4S binding protein [Leminorella grimontii]KFC94954.1 NapF family periplasmic nitrate reductase ferredoxin-type component [Leminorella grimontii ATCC 33999 = DSM 5078]GKX56920.1 (Fe-S)-binding protein [Leminorella grimontii]GKX60865.1 (Fe-S)-binding protein [Leminorella grimontii]VFS61159.1 ferredoxin-type protein [Leminorella grimontii]